MTLTADPAPLTYIETHAGRGVYDLSGAEAKKTGEAKEGEAALAELSEDHPYRSCIAQTQTRYGKHFYPGSPQIARLLLRPSDTLHLHELHPQEYAALTARIKARNIRMYKKDGLKAAPHVLPSHGGRTLVLIDPSYEVKSDYEAVAACIHTLKAKCPEAQMLVWYPVLEAGLHLKMLAALETVNPKASNDIYLFPETTKLRMKGSGMWKG